MSLPAAIVLSFVIVSQALKPSFISSNVMSFEQAEMFCKQNGGHLAQPSSARDEYFEDNELEDVCYWFGAYALPSGGYYWTNGTAIPWHNWNTGDDEIYCTMAECAMVMKAIDHKWLHTTGPDEKYQALCEPSAIVDVPVNRLSQLELQMNQWRARSLVRFGTTESTIKDMKKLTSEKIRRLERFCQSKCAQSHMMTTEESEVSTYMADETDQDQLTFSGDYVEHQGQ